MPAEASQDAAAAFTGLCAAIGLLLVLGLVGGAVAGPGPAIPDMDNLLAETSVEPPE